MNKIRMLIAKVGLDGHDRGAIILSRALQEHGMQVIYTGIRKSPEQICEIAKQNNVDVIGLSSLAGAHLYLFPKVMNELKKKDLEHIPVIAGGIIPKKDINYLKQVGINKIVSKDETIESIVLYIRNLVSHHK